MKRDERMRILICGIYIISIIMYVLGSIYLSRKIIKNFNPNRWIIAFLSPFVIIVPVFLIKNINPVIWSILIAIFIFLCILFFEINTNISENKGNAKNINYKKSK